MGAANFAILGKLRVSLVAQAIVFVIMVYILSIVKAADPRRVHHSQFVRKCVLNYNMQVIRLLSPRDFNDLLWGMLFGDFCSPLYSAYSL